MIKSGIVCGDAREVLEQTPGAWVDLVMTSPPYADSRKNTYGGVVPGQYVEWFLPISAQLFRVLKPGGSFVLNIKEKVAAGERSTYVLELILALRAQGWLWTEEYCWHKKSAAPGKWPNRFRDAWERCLHFTKQRNFKMNQNAVMVPVGKWAETRLKKPSEIDKRRVASTTGSPFGAARANWKGRGLVFPTNVLHLSAESSNEGHSAVFPEALPEWFIKLFTDPGDVILDPFVGSGTTAVAACRLGRQYVGIDNLEENCVLARERVAKNGG